MAYSYGTLGSEVDGKIGYIYPKTVAKLVELEDGTSVEETIDNINKELIDVTNRINNIVAGVDYGSLSSRNDAELLDIRVPNTNIVPESTIYNSAGDAIRDQLQILSNKIDNLQKDVDEIKNSLISV